MKLSGIKDKTELPVVLRIDPHIMQIMGMGRVHAYELAKRQEFPSMKIVKTVFVSRDAFFNWLNNYNA